MSAKPSSFTITALKRALQGVGLAGLEVGRVEIDKSGKICIIPKNPRETAAIKPMNDWDEAFSGKTPSQIR
jgi:hypothetical protein